jgi:dipeptidyl-peptidase-3
MLELHRVRSGRLLELDHQRGRHLIVHWMLEDGRAVAVRRRDGRTFYVMTDIQAFRDAAGRLLTEIQRIKSDGDMRAARTLVLRYGTYLDERLRDEVVARSDRLWLRGYVASVMPRLEPVLAPDGEIADVRVSYPQNLTSQMLEYSAQSPRRA